MSDACPISKISIRVNYSETDQMGVVYHARYLVWLDIARTEHLRQLGASYRDLEAGGLRLAVGEAALRYRQAARFDDLVTIRCWIRALQSRRIDFGYQLERTADGAPLGTAATSLLVLDATMAFTRLPHEVRRLLTVVPDPVPLQLTLAGDRVLRTHGR